LDTPALNQAAPEASARLMSLACYEALVPGIVSQAAKSADRSNTKE
jgi:hypothetical protein